MHVICFMTDVQNDHKEIENVRKCEKMTIQSSKKLKEKKDKSSHGYYNHREIRVLKSGSKQIKRRRIND